MKKQIVFDAQTGSYPSHFKTIKCILHGIGNNLSGLTANQQLLKVQPESVLLLDGLRYLHDVYDATYFTSIRDAEKKPVQETFTFQNRNGEVLIEWQ